MTRLLTKLSCASCSRNQAPTDGDPAHAQALAAAHEWLAHLPKPEHRDSEHYMLGCFARDATARLGD